MRNPWGGALLDLAIEELVWELSGWKCVLTVLLDVCAPLAVVHPSKS
jgi:hypothetical protein